MHPNREERVKYIREEAWIDFKPGRAMMNRGWILLFAGLAVGGWLLLREEQMAPRTARAAESFPVPPPKEPEVRNREARRVEDILEELSARNSRDETGPKYRISESELNSYLSYLIERDGMKAVDALFVKLHSGFFSTYAIIDTDRIPQEKRDPATRVLMKTVLTGKWHVS
ncbi:MAG: hypothetical protein HYX74_04450, partial [Acidobacteria bacterium]|nr:hypothetical protein [Acidobacteriota bacterium]